jgi:hypothetical protein
LILGIDIPPGLLSISMRLFGLASKAGLNHNLPSGVTYDRAAAE